MEVWKDIKGFEGQYQISNYGRVKSLQRKDGRNHTWPERILRFTVGTNGYCGVRLSKNGKVFPKEIHRMVAEHFIENPNNYPCVNHIDENKSNNNVSNLEWCTYQYNNSYGTKGQRLSESNLKTLDTNKRCRKVVQMDMDGNEIARYRSVREAERKVGVAHSYLSACMLGKFESAKGYRWKYAE